MHDNPDDALERALTLRRMEAPSAGLADRIARAALGVPQVEPVRLGAWLARLFGEFPLPSPAMAAAVVLTLGVLTGLGIPAATAEMETAGAESFLYDEGVML